MAFLYNTIWKINRFLSKGFQYMNISLSYEPKHLTFLNYKIMLKFFSHHDLTFSKWTKRNWKKTPDNLHENQHIKKLYAIKEMRNIKQNFHFKQLEAKCRKKKQFFQQNLKQSIVEVTEERNKTAWLLHTNDFGRYVKNETF